MARTRFSKTGQPVINTPMEVQMDDLSWMSVTVVGKLYGKGGNSDLIGVIVEDAAEGACDRIRLPWPFEYLRAVDA